jgi:predicted metal-dependent phosphoesterase TrpH
MATIRAVTHIHTKRSWDGVIKPDSLAALLHDDNIDLALVTDHDSFEGAREVTRAVEDRGFNIRVPVAAEIRTDLGDLIIVFDEVEPPPVAQIKVWRNLVAAARDLGGLVWYPHPFRSHPDPYALAEHVDVIEVFNSRCSEKENELAARMCAEVGAVPAYGSDAHLRREVPGVVVEYEVGSSVIETLQTEPGPLRTRRAKKSDKDLAEIVNGFKRRRPTLVGYFSARYVAHMTQERLGNTSDDAR